MLSETGTRFFIFLKFQKSDLCNSDVDFLFQNQSQMIRYILKTDLDTFGLMLGEKNMQEVFQKVYKSLK